MPPIANKEWQALCVHFFQFMTFQRSCAAICGYVLCMYVVNSSNVIILFRVIKRQFCYVMMTTASKLLIQKNNIHDWDVKTPWRTPLYVPIYRVPNMDWPYSRSRQKLWVLFSSRLESTQKKTISSLEKNSHKICLE